MYPELQAVSPKSKPFTPNTKGHTGFKDKHYADDSLYFKQHPELRRWLSKDQPLVPGLEISRVNTFSYGSIDVDEGLAFRDQSLGCKV
jgi:hypothetical protein